jgi:hypothetical protein
VSARTHPSGTVSTTDAVLEAGKVLLCRCGSSRSKLVRYATRQTAAFRTRPSELALTSRERTGSTSRVVSTRSVVPERRRHCVVPLWYRLLRPMCPSSTSLEVYASMDSPEGARATTALYRSFLLKELPGIALGRSKSASGDSHAPDRRTARSDHESQFPRRLSVAGPADGGGARGGRRAFLAAGEAATDRRAGQDAVHLGACRRGLILPKSSPQSSR